jgi:hypothetical protein
MNALQIPSRLTSAEVPATPAASAAILTTW